MKNNKQSSIDWLEQELKKIPFVNVLDVFKQAKAMHKDEIEDAYTSNSILRTRSKAEQYYNETFNTNKK